MGIRVSTKTKAKATLKLANNIRSYLFEQENNELNNYTFVKEKLRRVLDDLNIIINNSK